MQEDTCVCLELGKEKKGLLLSIDFWPFLEGKGKISYLHRYTHTHALSNIFIQYEDIKRTRGTELISTGVRLHCRAFQTCERQYLYHHFPSCGTHTGRMRPPQHSTWFKSSTDRRLFLKKKKRHHVTSSFEILKIRSGYFGWKKWKGRDGTKKLNGGAASAPEYIPLSESFLKKKNLHSLTRKQSKQGRVVG